MHPSLDRRSLSFCLALLSLIALLPSSALAQSTGGRIVGRVADPTGAVLAGVKVTLTNQATGASRRREPTTAATTALWKLCPVPTTRVRT